MIRPKMTRECGKPEREGGREREGEGGRVIEKRESVNKQLH